MPRKTAQTLEFRLPEDILTSVDSSLTSLVVVNRSSQDKLNELHDQLKNTHLGHELHLWEAEVKEF